MKDQAKLEEMIRERLEEIKPIPARDPMIATQSRAQFLANAVSAGNIQRHKGWNSIFRKEQFAMNMIVSLLVVASLLFGSGATVSAAQKELPGEPLYPLKLWSEDISLQLQNNQGTSVDHLLDLAQIRIQEMTQLVAKEKPIPDSVQHRLGQHLQDVLQLCASMDDATLDRTLIHVRDRLQQQDRDLDRLQIHTQKQDTLNLLTQTRTMLLDRLQLVEDGLLDHEIFRETVRNGQRNGQETTPTPADQNGFGQQNGQPTSAPGMPSPTTGRPFNTPGNTIMTPGNPNTDPGEPNTNNGGSNSGSGTNTGSGSNNTSGNGTGGNGTGGNRP